MANDKQLNTRIILRHDNTGNWTTAANAETASTLLLMAGEPGVELSTTEGGKGKARVKIGDGVHTWANLEYIGDDIRIDSLLSIIGSSTDTAAADGSLYARLKKNAEDIAATNTALGAAGDTADASGSAYARIAQNAADIDALETLVGTTADAANATGSAYARIAQNAADISDRLTIASFTAYTADHTYTDSQIDGLVGGAFHFKGTAYKEMNGDTWTGDLVTEEGGSTKVATGTGYVYQVGTSEYAYNGSQWVELGSNLDLSAYATQAWTTSAIAAASTTLIGTSADTSADNTIYGAKALANSVSAMVVDYSTTLAASITAISTTIGTASDAANASGSVFARIADANNKIGTANTAGSGEASNATGVYAYIDSRDTAVMTALKGDPVGDSKDSDTIAGAKKYADSVANGAVTTVVGTASDSAAASTIYGAKAYADNAASTVLGTASDTAGNHTVYGAFAAAQAAQNAADAKVASVTASNAGIVIGGNATNPSVGVVISTATGNIVSISADGLYATAPAASEYSVEKATTADSGYAATYYLTKDGAEVSGATRIQIPKDYLVKSANLLSCTATNVPEVGYEVGDKYIDFVVNTTDNTATETHIYLKVSDLVDAYNVADTNSGLTMTNNKFSVNVTNGNGLTKDNNTISLALASSTTAGAMSAAHYDKLEGIEAGAEVNVLEGVSINGAALTATNKVVDIPIATASVLGVVLSTSAVNGVSVNGTTGAMEVNNINISKLTQDAGQYLIINGGNAALS